MNFSLLHPRDQIVETMERIYSRNMTTTSGGNISIHDENGDKWITPARVDKGSLRRQDVVHIGKDGECEGLHPPSSESPFHLSVYAARPDIRAIIHAHPGALVSFSICGQIPNTRLFPESWNICGEVTFAPYEIPGSKQLGARIAEAFASESKPNCVVLENHGVVVGGSNLAEAFQRFETLEFTAQTIINARQLGEVHYLSDKQIAFSNDPRILMLEGESQPMTSREKELRQGDIGFRPSRLRSPVDDKHLGKFFGPHRGQFLHRNAFSCRSTGALTKRPRRRAWWPPFAGTITQPCRATTWRHLQRLPGNSGRRERPTRIRHGLLCQRLRRSIPAAAIICSKDVGPWGPSSHDRPTKYD